MPGDPAASAKAIGLDAPLPPDITPKPGFPRKTPMLKANGGDFPSDPEALPPMIGSAPIYASRHLSQRVPTKPVAVSPHGPSATIPVPRPWSAHKERAEMARLRPKRSS